MPVEFPSDSLIRSLWEPDSCHLRKLLRHSGYTDEEIEILLEKYKVMANLNKTIKEVLKESAPRQ